MNPQDGSYWYRYGNKCYEEKRWEEAAIAFAKAGKHGYDCRIPVSGECYYKLGKYNEALMAYADAYSYHYAVLGVIARTLRKLVFFAREKCTNF
jgi:tetratricopeptide (TPR) repeat protein